jgi:uncharacterized membrane protein YadS
VYGNPRLSTAIAIAFSAAVIVYTWLVPSEKKKTTTVLATVFVFNLNVYFLSPALTIANNAKEFDIYGSPFRPKSF